MSGRTVFSPSLDLLGIAWFDDTPGPPPLGLLIGRLERRAWLSSQKLRPDDDLYEVSLGLEPDRVDPEDLEPTLGRKVKRTVRLHHRDGQLPDEWQAFNIVEAIGLTLTANGTRQPTRWSGETRDAPDLVELLGAVARIRSQFAELRRGGVRHRLFDRQADGRRELRHLLERRNGEILVIDPWLRDWSLIAGLARPPRVLIGADVPEPPAHFAGRIRRWRGGGAAPFHDRFFLWEGGGVSVGTSAGALRDRLFRLVRIGAVESDELRERFALWWSDPGFEKLS